MNKIKKINAADINNEKYPKQYTSCVILNYDNKLIVQQRGKNWSNYPNYISLFGGKVEKSETSVVAIIRELNEELGAKANPYEISYLGAITEAVSNHKELIHEFFWHDINNTMTGCYEGEILIFDNPEQLLTQPKLIDDVPWAIKQCQERNLI